MKTPANLEAAALHSAWVASDYSDDDAFDRYAALVRSSGVRTMVAAWNAGLAHYATAKGMMVEVPTPKTVGPVVDSDGRLVNVDGTSFKFITIYV